VNDETSHDPPRVLATDAGAAGTDFWVDSHVFFPTGLATGLDAICRSA
jgi:hypothetical protein